MARRAGECLGPLSSPRRVGLVGFDDLRTATRLRHRWFGASKVVSSSDTTWNPHPLNGTFAPSLVVETSMQARKDSHAAP
jgi:hypothetical protein